MRYKDKVNDNIDPEYYQTLAMIESSGNPNAKASTSSASGLYQFTKGTWKSLVDQMGLEYNMDDRFDPKKSRKVVEEFTKQNYKYLKGRLNRDVSAPELYLAHFLGMGGSRNLLAAYDKNPNMSVADVLDQAQIKANKSVFYTKEGTLRKVKDIYNWANKKFGIEPEEYDYYNDPDKYYVEENRIENRRRTENLNEIDEPDYTVPMEGEMDLDLPLVYLPEDEEEAEPTQVAEAKEKIDNRQQILQGLMAANAVQYIDPNEKMNDGLPEPNSYGYPSMQKGGESKKKVEEDYGVVDFAKDAYEAWFNPKNYGVDDYSKKGDFDAAYQAARKNGEKEFMYKNRRYNTNYKGTPSEQLRETGITDDQLQDRNWMQDRLKDNLYPVGYDNMKKRVFDAVVRNEKDPKRIVEESDSPQHNNRFTDRRMDAYNLYMGIPQENNTFSISNYTPSKSKDKDAVYYSITSKDLKDQLINSIGDDGKLEFDKIKGKEKLTSVDHTGVMSNFNIALGEDEKGQYISYYDKWDIEPMDFGKPMEIYDRVYYEKVDKPTEEEYYNAVEEIKRKKKEISDGWYEGATEGGVNPEIYEKTYPEWEKLNKKQFELRKLINLKSNYRIKE